MDHLLFGSFFLVVTIGHISCGASRHNTSDVDLRQDLAGAACPSVCNCIGTLQEAICSLGDTEGELPDVPHLTSSLVLRGAKLQILSNETFARLLYLKNLTLSGNHIQDIRPHAFQRHPQLWTLDLSKNSIGPTLRPHAFGSMLGLALLDISQNHLEVVRYRTFDGLENLAMLNLSNNAIESIEPRAFENLRRLQRLDLSHNKIRALNFKCLDTLKALKSFSLKGNRLEMIPAYAFHFLVSLESLDLSTNNIHQLHTQSFFGLNLLVNLYLHDNNLHQLPARFLEVAPNLEILTLGNNEFVSLNRSQFSPSQNLREIYLEEMPRLEIIFPEAFSGLPHLKTLVLRNNPRLQYLHPMAFQGASSIKRLDIANNNLHSLYHAVLRPLQSLTELGMHGNPWVCGCGLQWLNEFLKNRPFVSVIAPQETRCASPPELKGTSLFDANGAVQDLSQRGHEEPLCSTARVTFLNPHTGVRPGSTALLECSVTGNPSPTMMWITPRYSVLHWYPDDGEGGAAYAYFRSELYKGSHPTAHDHEGKALEGELRSHIQVLHNGNLFITGANSADAGTYVCVASNALGNSSASASLTLDYEILTQVKVVSFLVGLASSVAFMLLMLLVQLAHTILDRWGWACCWCCRCCSGLWALTPKSRRLRQVLESVDQYKRQQLAHLRENYHLQMQKIKDNGAGQMERLRESYAIQSERFRDFRDYGTQQLDHFREQYYDQVRRVRDYTTSQMNRVRENYILQRNRVCKFSAHQLVKLRDNYKLQHMHLNKILETLNLESCRTVCSRTDSVMFETATDMKFPISPLDVAGLHLSSLGDSPPNSSPMEMVALSLDVVDNEFPQTTMVVTDLNEVDPGGECTEEQRPSTSTRAGERLEEAASVRSKYESVSESAAESSHANLNEECVVDLIPDHDAHSKCSDVTNHEVIV